jgi:Flp pilus assembly pilin Flp
MNKLTTQVLVAQAFLSAFVATRMHTAAQRREERGVVSIEYIVLGAAIILLIGVLGTATEVQTALKTAFTNLFSNAG